MKMNAEIAGLMNERFGHDNLIALATVDGDSPAVRTVNAYYEDGCFYAVTYALSGKMQHIAKNPQVAICGDWFTARGFGENMGHILLPEMPTWPPSFARCSPNGMATAISTRPIRIPSSCE